MNKIERRQRIRYRIRKVVSGTAQRPRMSIFRSNKQIYVQFIDDVNGNTLAAVSSLDKAIAPQTKGKTNIEVAAMVGKKAAEVALEKGIKEVVFDRGGFIYQGKVAALADAAREAGLQF